MLVGVDTGGTFTDILLRDDSGELRVFKLLSTPEDPSVAVGDGVERVVEAVDRDRIPELVHGTTVATNALLEREGARTAFVTTEGFEDLLELQRQDRPDLYALNVERVQPVVGADDCYGVGERVNADGDVLCALDGVDLEQLADQFEGEDYEAAAICLLHAYANPDHERRIAERLDEMSDLHVSASHDVVGVFREYERASTTVLNAYVAPVMSRYLERLRDRVPADAIDVLQSSGGRTGIEHAATYPVHTLLSGPAGGVVGARAAGRELGRGRVISLDMGGTSTDVSLCDGELEVTTESEVDGLPVQVPVIDIHTVGAGGGSIAYVDPGGGLRVGPESAGANPGPACYGRGGSRPTVTDAHAVLGRVRPGRFLGGRMDLEFDRARKVVSDLGRELGMGVEETARGILEVAESSMRRALKVISLERGHDPREFTLVAFGGAGPLHACRLAESLEMPGVVIPRNPGLASAYGMLHADFQRLATRSVLEPVDEFLSRPGAARDLMETLRADALRDADGAEDVEYVWTAELRYAGQSFEVDVPLDWSLDDAEVADPTESFEQRHEELYGYRAEDRSVELVAVRLQARRPGPDPSETGAHVAKAGRAPEEPLEDDVGFAEGTRTATIYDRRAFEEGDRFRGPAVVAEYSGTTVVPPGWGGRCDSGHLLLERRDEA